MEIIAKLAATVATIGVASLAVPAPKRSIDRNPTAGIVVPKAIQKAAANFSRNFDDYQI